MFPNATQQSQFKNACRKAKIIISATDSFEQAVFKVLLGLMTKIESLEKQIKDLEDDNS